jgi:RimJ/RimL family protein N-acetyltransferase
MIIAETPRLRICNWREDDRDLFCEINSDPVVMEFFPKRRDRAESDAFFDFNRSRIAETGFGFYALRLKDDDQAIGFCGLAIAGLPGIFADDAIEIGWRLAHPFWGNGYVTEAAIRLLEHGFETRGLSEIVSFAVAQNARSTAVMERIGLKRAEHYDFRSPRVPDSMPHLKQHVVYALSADEWRSGR